MFFLLSKLDSSLDIDFYSVGTGEGESARHLGRFSGRLPLLVVSLSALRMEFLCNLHLRYPFLAGVTVLLLSYLIFRRVFPFLRFTSKLVIEAVQASARRRRATMIFDFFWYAYSLVNFVFETGFLGISELFCVVLIA